MIFGQGGKSRNVLRQSFAMKRYTVARVVFDLFESEVILKSRSNDAGRNAIHADIEIRRFARQGAGELWHGSLCYAIGNRAGTIADPGCRGD